MVCLCYIKTFLSSYSDIIFFFPLKIYEMCCLRCTVKCVVVRTHMHVWCVKMNVSVCVSCIHAEIMCCWDVCSDGVSQRRTSLAHRAAVVCCFCLEILERLKRKITEHKTTVRLWPWCTQKPPTRSSHSFLIVICTGLDNLQSFLLNESRLRRRSPPQNILLLDLSDHPTAIWRFAGAWIWKWQTFI